MTPERAISPPRIGNRQCMSRCVVDVQTYWYENTEKERVLAVYGSFPWMFPLHCVVLDSLSTAGFTSRAPISCVFRLLRRALAPLERHSCIGRPSSLWSLRRGAQP